ncbi:HAD family hydrolase [Marinactinospora thermotolerans]|uniref:Putative hydrolase of the HAD superfamily n=1 Tax=Marinactinospora thermotolerans DSM 45154 TaxID=1122192 RepID=A0A1T4SM39_9ACTN|nr:HAD family phosphatase [Marinactinospora thermotolerans]SKA29257.1 putative hydrolase of the HAD superfamily [Marinactinospora thermotolerans DSM 45154]
MGVPAEDGSITTVLFDYGEVISVPPPPEVRSALERLSGATAEDFWAAYWAERRPYDAGLSSAEYWDRVAARIGADWDAARRQELWATDVGGWLYAFPPSVALIHRLADRGVRLALLSNAPSDIAGALRASPLLERFDALFFSCDLGMCKPDPEVYHRVLADLDADPAEVAFIDDREENVLAAKRIGIDAHHFGGITDLESFLIDRIGTF